MLIKKTIIGGRSNERLNTGVEGFWVRVKVLGIPVYTKFVDRAVAGDAGRL